eukprot:86159-Pelagomonas_calceolata.AAC.3
MLLATYCLKKSRRGFITHVMQCCLLRNYLCISLPKSGRHTRILLQLAQAAESRTGVMEYFRHLTSQHYALSS